MTTPDPRDAATPEAALAAHDLRNLLTTVLGHAELQLQALEAGAPAAEPEELRRSLDAMRLAATRAVTLCEGILAADGDARVEPLELGEVARGAAELLLTGCGTTVEVHIRGEESVPVHGRRDALERALLNLMWNAVDAQAGAARQEVQLSWGSDTTGPWVEVRDRGPGLPEGRLGDLGSAGRSTRGAGRGLGLHGVARTMRQHGGRLRGHDREGGGAVLRMEFGLERELDFDGLSQGT